MQKSTSLTLRSRVALSLSDMPATYESESGLPFSSNLPAFVQRVGVRVVSDVQQRMEPSSLDELARHTCAMRNRFSGCRAKSAHTRQSRPDSDPGFQVIDCRPLVRSHVERRCSNLGPTHRIYFSIRTFKCLERYIFFPLRSGVDP